MKLLLIFVMLINNIQHDKTISSNLNTPAGQSQPSLMGIVDQPSARAGLFAMENLDLFNQPKIKRDWLTQDLVKLLFDYQDGKLFWRVKQSTNVSIGQLAGTIAKDKKGDRHKVMINKYACNRSRIIFLWHEGWLPEMVDHKDGNKLNDRIENLRAATHTQNNRNRISKLNTTSIYKGVTYRKNVNIPGVWTAFIKFNNKRRYLGGFKTEVEAAVAYNEAALKEFGEFANINVIKTNA